MFSRRIRDIWTHLSIRIKFLISFFGVLILVSGFNLYLTRSNYGNTDQFNQTVKNYYAINRMNLLVVENYNALESYLRTLDVNQKEQYQQTKLEIQNMIEPLYVEFDSRDIYFLVRAISNATNEYFAHFDKAIADREQGVKNYYVSFYEGSDIQKYVAGYIQSLLNLSLNEGTERYGKLADKALMTGRISVVLIVAMFLFAMMIGLLLANKLVNPIKRLADASMSMARGDLDVEPVSIGSKDEIGVLADSFSIMSANIRKYVQDLQQKVEIEKKLHEEELEIVRMEQLVREARFEALQSQINPHFLFNTLNTISRTALFENAEKSVKLTQALSNLFRYRLRQKSAIVPLSEELYMIGEYIYLQKVRFGERLDYFVSVEDACKAIPVPIFLFQPLVENAIIHGIEPKIRGGKIRIKAVLRKGNTEEELLVRITDTGIGMDRERLEQVKSFEAVQEKNIGLANVYHRLRIASSQNAQVSIRSRLNRGTSIEIRFAKELFQDVKG